MTTLQTLQQILASEYRIDAEQAKPDAQLTALGLDSLSVIELMFKIEDAFELTLDKDTPTNLVTVNDVVEYIDGLLASRRPAGAPPAPPGA